MADKENRNWSWASVSSKGSHHTVAMKLSTMVKVLLVVVLLIISFWGGTLYGHDSNSNNSLISVGPASHHKFALGIIVYISPQSITISNENNTNTQVFAITSATLISINGHKAPASRLKPGNIVLIRVAKNNSGKAGIILANSHFSG